MKSKPEKGPTLRKARDMLARLLRRSPLSARSAIRKGALSKGYHYVRIRVEDLDTGEDFCSTLYVACKPEKSAALHDRLEKQLMWPRELLKGAAFEYQDYEARTHVRADAANLLDLRALGGRPKGKRPVKVEAEYRRIINLRTSPQWRGETDTKFAKAHPEYRHKLRRAKLWALDNNYKVDHLRWR